jgi:hypothetical protein
VLLAFLWDTGSLFEGFSFKVARLKTDQVVVTQFSAEIPVGQTSSSVEEEKTWIFFPRQTALSGAFQIVEGDPDAERNKSTRKENVSVPHPSPFSLSRA